MVISNSSKKHQCKAKTNGGSGMGRPYSIESDSTAPQNAYELQKQTVALQKRNLENPVLIKKIVTYFPTMPPIVCPMPPALFTWLWHSCGQVKRSMPSFWTRTGLCDHLDQQSMMEGTLRHADKNVTHFHVVFLECALCGSQLPCQESSNLGTACPGKAQTGLRGEGLRLPREIKTPAAISTAATLKTPDLNCRLSLLWIPNIQQVY